MNVILLFPLSVKIIFQSSYFVNGITHTNLLDSYDHSLDEASKYREYSE